MAKQLQDFLTREEVHTFLTIVDAEGGKYAFRDRVMVEVMFWCGLRVSEVIKLQILNIDFTEKSLTLLNTKGGKSRVVPIKEEVLHHIKLYIEFSRKKAKYYREDPLFVRLGGKMLTTRRVQQLIKKYTTIYGGNKHIHPHTFRHSFAVHCSVSGVPPKILQQMLGHEWMSTTEVYVNHLLSFEEVKKAYEKVI